MHLEREYVKINAQKYKFAKDYHICLNIRWAFSQKIIPQKGVSHLLFDPSQKISWGRKRSLSHFFLDNNALFAEAASAWIISINLILGNIYMPLDKFVLNI